MNRLLAAFTITALALVPLPGPAQDEPEDPAIEMRDPDPAGGCSQETAAVDATQEQLFAAEPKSLMWDLYYEVYVEAKVAEAACVAQWEGICGVVGQHMLKFAHDDLEIEWARYNELEFAFEHCPQEGHPGQYPRQEQRQPINDDALGRGLKSEEGREETSILFVNGMNEAADVFWMDYDGQRRFWFMLEPGEERPAGHIRYPSVARVDIRRCDIRGFDHWRCL